MGNKRKGCFSLKHRNQTKAQRIQTAEARTKAIETENIPPIPLTAHLPSIPTLHSPRRTRSGTAFALTKARYHTAELQI